MSKQAGEKIFFNGEEMLMYEVPFEDYLSQSGLERPNFSSSSTAFGRGYCGTWKIHDDHLYLIKLSDNYFSLDEGVGHEAALASYFPDSTGRVLADWYSGTLHLFSPIFFPPIGFIGWLEKFDVYVTKGVIEKITPSAKPSSTNYVMSEDDQIRTAEIERLCSEFKQGFQPD